MPNSEYDYHGELDRLKRLLVLKITISANSYAMALTTESETTFIDQAHAYAAILIALPESKDAS